MGAWVNLKLEVLQNESFSTTLLFFNPPVSGTDPADQVPVDFTGATATLSVRKAQSDTAAQLLELTSGGGGLTFVSGTFQGGPPVPAAPNGIQIDVTPAQSEPLDPGANWYWDLLVEWGLTKAYVARGQFQVTATAAR